MRAAAWGVEVIISHNIYMLYKTLLKENRLKTTKTFLFYSSSSMHHSISLYTYEQAQKSSNFLNLQERQDQKFKEHNNSFFITQRLLY